MDTAAATVPMGRKSDDMDAAPDDECRKAAKETENDDGDKTPAPAGEMSEWAAYEAHRWIPWMGW